MASCRESLYFEPSVQGVRPRYWNVIPIQSFASLARLSFRDQFLMDKSLIVLATTHTDK